MTERVVIFGGTFNPIHHGHLIVARAVAEHWHFDRITFMPTAIAPHKPSAPAASSPASAQDRLAMIRLAIAGEGLFDVSDLELQRPGPSFTIDTLLQLRDRHGLDVPLFWIVGADMLADLPTWRRAEDVVNMATIITAARPPYSQQLATTLDRLRQRFGPELSTRLAQGVAPTPSIDISSTQIRHRVRDGKSVKYLTPDSVIHYIRVHHLYAAP